MIFSEANFGLFFAIVFALYLALSHRGQNRMLLVASYTTVLTGGTRFSARMAPAINVTMPPLQEDVHNVSAWP